MVGVGTFDGVRAQVIGLSLGVETLMQELMFLGVGSGPWKISLD